MPAVLDDLSDSTVGTTRRSRSVRTTVATAAAMGTSVRIVAVGAQRAPSDRIVQRAIARVHELEARWSRFRPASEISRLNAARGMPCLVSADTALLIAEMLAAHRRSGGRFDPTVLVALEDLGYSTSWPLPAVAGDHTRALVPGCVGVSVDRSTGLAWLPPGVRLDPGGIGKGLAADLVAEQLRGDGVAGCLVDIGGDVRVSGEAPDADVWTIGIEDPRQPTRCVAVVETADGAVATSSRRRRRWRLADGTPTHHVVDPATARAAQVPWVSASALAATAVAAEVGATVAFLDGPAAVVRPVLATVVVDADAAMTTGGPHPHLIGRAPLADA